MQNYRKLEVWQKAHQLTLWLYRVTKDWPKEELYGLTSQVRRAAVSILANLAEGGARYGSAEFARFVHLAAGSAAELDCEPLIARDLGYLSPEEHSLWEDELAAIGRMLTALSQKLASSVQRPASAAKR